MHVTRIAPSPSGELHIGNVRTAYFNWLAARASGGKFILRIDDTDAARSKPEYVEAIIESFKWLGLDFDALEFQSKRTSRYKELADQWLQRGLAHKEDGTIKFKMPEMPEAPTQWKDEIIADPIKITLDDYAAFDNFIMFRSDGSPTYNWASVIDDMDMGVNYIIRGQDHVTNTSKQVILWHLLGYERPKFAHVGLIGLKSRPLHKRDGAATISYYREKGYDPDAVLNFIGRMGWSPHKDDKTTAMLSKDRMLELFLTEGKMRPSLANMDLNKLESFDRKYKAQKGIWRTKEKLIQPEVGHAEVSHHL